MEVVEVVVDMGECLGWCARCFELSLLLEGGPAGTGTLKVLEATAGLGAGWLGGGRGAGEAAGGE